MIVNVTEQHIISGVRRSICACPVANACADVLKDFIFANPKKISTKEKNYKTPPNVIDRMRLFDNTGQMEPFSFELTDE